MKNRIDLTEGRITEKLIKLVLPIMGTAFIQMAYNLIDMIWVGKSGSNAVAAVGTAGFYPWLAMAFITISKVGAEVKVAQSIGADDKAGTKSYIKAAIEINVILASIYTMVLLLFNDALIGLFRLGDVGVITMSKQYLSIIAIGMIFYFMNPLFTAIFNGLGNSKMPFRINAMGLIINILLDPILILGWFGFPALGVRGAAIATVFAQVVVSLTFLYNIIKLKQDYFKIRPFYKVEMKYYKILYKLGMPVAIQSGMYTIFSMAIGVIVAAFGPVAIAVQKVGSQIESISWMTMEGLGVALSSFIGQNYGAQKYDRIEKVSKVAILISIAFGVINTFILVFFGEQLFSIFINESDSIREGTIYLRILGYSQLFMCLEIIVAGAFKGLGRTYIPSIVITVLTGLRVPAAYIASKPELLGLNGIWWSITVSSILKGTILISLFLWLLKIGKLYKKAEYQNS